jgi:hypothetical protein
MVTFATMRSQPFGTAAELALGEPVSSGFGMLDRLLPAGGVRRGNLLEWLGDGEASGAATLAFAVACRLAAEATVVVVDRRGAFHPPAVMGWLRERQLVVARASTDADEAWAIDQALRCRGVAAVLACPQSMHPTDMRRWQLAARTSGAVGLFVRPLGGQSRRQPTWAEARVGVAPLVGGSLTVRRLRLSLAGGPWMAMHDADERAVEIGIDLASGRDASGHQESTGIRIFQPRPRQPVEEVACRAS